MERLKKIVLTGPESSGKSWLCEKLAEHFGALWIPEYARIYLEKNGSNYSYRDYMKMAQEHQLYQQEKLNDAKGLVFLDTDMLNYAVWSDVVYHKPTAWVEEQILKETDHLYLIVYPDLSWESDPIRQNPNNRMMLFDKHLNQIEKHNRPYKTIKEQGLKRLENSIKATDFFLGH